MELEEKEVVAPESEENVVEVEDLDAGLTEKHVEVVKDQAEKKVQERHVLNPEQQKLFKKILEAAKMPVKLDDKKFKLGESELDIRGLSKANKEQMFFRTLVLSNVYLKQIMDTGVDILRAIFLIADAMGIEDIVGKTDEIIEKMNKRIKKEIKPQEENDEVKA